MSDTQEKSGTKGKRAVFNETDTKLLMDCIEKHANILNSKQTSGNALSMKNKVITCKD